MTSYIYLKGKQQQHESKHTFDKKEYTTITCVCQLEKEVRGMEKRITALVIEAHVEDIDSAKELLNDLETLLEKYDVTIDLKIYQSFQGSGTPI